MKRERWGALAPEKRDCVISVCRMAGIDFETECVSASGAEIGGKEAVAEEWWTLQDAVRFTHLSRWTIRRWCDKRLIRFRKTNKARCGRILIDAASLRRFILSCAGNAEEENCA